uniref:Ntox24 domain-containing protein n=1 Tax=Panagrellus redivivus TaxID=6233 RepID=A0A7E4UUQ6_PANRE
MTRSSRPRSPNDHHNESRSKHKRRKHRKTKRQHIATGRSVKLLPYVNEVPICSDVGSETTITFSKSSDKVKTFIDGNEGTQSDTVMRENGWCTSDGTPWGLNKMPQDEAALLKKGVVDRNGSRLTYCSPDPAYNSGHPRFYDELELLKEGYVDKAGRHKNLNAAADSTYPASAQKHSPPQLSTDPITIAELNSRGFVDPKGKLHFGIQSLMNSGNDKCTARAENDNGRHVVLKESHESLPLTKTCDLSRSSGSETRITFPPGSEASLQSSECNSCSCKKSKSRKKKSITPQAESPARPILSNHSNGTIRCEAGRNGDRASVVYTVTSDGRNYEVKTVDGHHIHLEFNKRHAYLMVD